jgi:L-arabinose transport system substrate-binding protein
MTLTLSPVRAAAVAVAMLSSLWLAGCGPKSNSPANGAAATPTKLKLGFLVKQPEEPWFQYEWKGADAAGAKHGFEVIKIGVPDGEKVLTAIDSLAASGAGGFVICTPDVRLGPAIVAKAKAAGLKVIAVDDRFVGADGKFLTEVPYLGMSASKIGHLAVTTLAAEMKHRGWKPEETAACIITFEELDTARERTDGAIAALKEAGFPAGRIFKAPQKTTDIPGSFDAANALLAQKTGIKHWLIAGMNDNAVLGAVRATEGQGFKAADVIGVGINGTDCIDELRKPAPTGFHGSIYASAPQEGYRTAELLYFWIKDGTVPPPDTRTEGQLITRENFLELLKQEGVL